MNSSSNWLAVKDALIYNETYQGARQPRANCLETTGPRTDLFRMRATTCLSLLFSNGYAVYAGPPAQGDHNHDWYHPFWSNHNLGTATSGAQSIGTNAWKREFQNGTAAWNLGGTLPVYLNFSELRTRRSDGARASQFTLPVNDANIYTK
jgi:hypothetical protein